MNDYDITIGNFRLTYKERTKARDFYIKRRDAFGNIGWNLITEKQHLTLIEGLADCIANLGKNNTEIDL